MKEIIDLEKCSGCTACKYSCPKKAIEMIENEEGFLYPTIDQEKCIDCKICQRVCPIEKGKTMPVTSCKAARNKNIDIRTKSSSGGIFYLLAEKILEENGVICGCTYGENGQVYHKIIDKKEDLKELYGSKYVQSNLKDSFSKIKKLLPEKRKVLFIGTPCQVGGLKSFLEKEQENLYTCDFICHGVPSPKVFHKYVKCLENKQKSKIAKYYFRSKKNGWKNFKTEVFFENGEKYIVGFQKDLYMNGFLKNIYLRPSCYQCSFKGENHIADITLGDYWGITSKEKVLNDDMGVSAIVIHSKKGEKLFKSIEKDCDIIESDEKDILNKNECYYKSVKKPSNRSLFFNNLEKVEVEAAIKNSLPKESIVRKMVKWIYHHCFLR